MDLDKAIMRRRSVRSFSEKKVRWDYILEAIDAANQAPFAGNINSLKFIIVEKQELKDKLAAHSQQLWISKASHIVVVASNKKHLENLYNERAEKYVRQQAGAAIENFLLKITDFKLASCWIGAFDDEAIKKDLGIPKEYEVEALLPVGHILKKKILLKKPRKNRLDTSVYWELCGISKKPNVRKDLWTP